MVSSQHCFSFSCFAFIGSSLVFSLTSCYSSQYALKEWMEVCILHMCTSSRFFQKPAKNGCCPWIEDHLSLPFSTLRHPFYRATFLQGNRHPFYRATFPQGNRHPFYRATILVVFLPSKSEKWLHMFLFQTAGSSCNPIFSLSFLLPLLALSLVLNLL